MLSAVKKPEKVIYYKPPKEEEEASGDIQQFLSFILVFAGIMLKVSYFF